MDNWIDIAYYCLKEEIKISSIIHDGKVERWFEWNEINHVHDKYGSDLRTVNLTNNIVIERGISKIIIDTTKYNGN